MPRPKSAVWTSFKTVSKNNKNYGQCIHCNKLYTINATKMGRHLKVCQRAPERIRKAFSSNNYIQPTHQSDNKSCSSMSTSSTLTSFLDNISEPEQTKLEQYLARAIYSSCAPLSLLENHYFQRFFSYLRPSFKLPSRKKLSTTLLNSEYERIRNVVTAKINSANSLTLLSDGWTDVNGVSLLNIIFTTPEPVFVKTIHSGIERHTSDYLAKVFIDEIEAVGSHRISGIVTDNAAAMKGAWGLIQEKYPHIIAYGCFAHGLNLLSKDLATINSISRIISLSKDIVQFFNNKHIPKEVFKKVQEERGETKITLKTPVDTRWGTYVIMLQSLLKNINNLKAACVDRDLFNHLDNHVKNNIEDNRFWDKVQRSSDLLEPILHVINMVEGDKATLPYVYKHLKDIENKLVAGAEMFPDNERNKIIGCWQSRKSFMSHEAQLAASFLHPNQHDAYLNDTEINQVIDFIIKLGNHLNFDETELLTDLVQYRTKSNDFSNKTFWKVSSNVSSLTWWAGFFPKKLLSKIAGRLLCMPATTGSCERNFKLHSNIKTSKRNRLCIRRTEKIVYIKHNLQFLEEDLKYEDDELIQNVDPERTKGALDLIIKDDNSDTEESEDYETEDLVEEESENEIEEEDDTENNVLDRGTCELEIKESLNEEVLESPNNTAVMNENGNENLKLSTFQNNQLVPVKYLVQGGKKIIILDNYKL